MCACNSRRRKEKKKKRMETETLMKNRNPTILFFHGAYQNARIFEKATDRLQKLLEKSGYRVKIMEGIAPVDDPTVTDDENEKRMYWPFPRPFIFGVVDGQLVQNAVDHVMKTLPCEPEDVVGILGFSQGTKIAVAMAARLPNVKAMVLIAGFHCPTPIHLEAQEKCAQKNIPSMHIVGERDTLVPRELYDKFRDAFPNHVEMIHSQGHVVPSSGPSRAAIANFFTERLRV
jgi:pimeloyl-ACP methyl ester carboxylesterase